MVNKRLIVALSAIGAALAMALVCLQWSTWASSPLPGIILLSDHWTTRSLDSSPRWLDYVMGAAQIGGYTSGLFVYGKSPWKQNAWIFNAGLVWGMFSWFAGVFVVVAGLWGVFATMYATKRWDEENRTLAAKRDWPTLGRARWEAAAALMLGSGFSVGMKFGLMQGFVYSSVAAAWTFIVLIVVVEAFHMIEPTSTQPAKMN